MTDELDRAVSRVLDRLSIGQVQALAAVAVPLAAPDGSVAATVVGAQPAARAEVTALCASWTAAPGMTGAGIALALRTGLFARAQADACRSRPVWTGPGAVGEQRLTAGVLHELVAAARKRILLVSFAAYTLPSLANDLELAIAEHGCEVDVIFETEDDAAGGYKAHESKPFGDVDGIRRWRWPAANRTDGAVLHAKALIIDGQQALIGSANLTKRALSANLEVGVLVRDPAVAGELEDHLRRLMHDQVLTRVSDDRSPL